MWKAIAEISAALWKRRQLLRRVRAQPLHRSMVPLSEQSQESDMCSSFFHSLIAATACCVLAAFPGFAQNARGGGRAASANGVPRAWDGHPDLDGIWEALNTANWDLEDH